MQESVNKIYVNTGNHDVAKLINHPCSTVLDVGCGSGALAKILSERGHIVDGITISPDEYKISQKHCRKVFIHNLEMGLPEEIIKSTYDYVICSHVLEHIVYPARLLNNIHSVIRSGGYLVVALPNIMHYKSRIKLALGEFEYHDAGIWDHTHVKWYTFETTKKMLLEYNFVIELATVTGDLPFNRLFTKVLPISIRKGIFNFLTSVSKGLFGYQLLFKAKKI